MAIQGVPDLGPGLRLHLNENTGGCSPKVVEAVRAFTAERLALYPDFTDAVRETAAFLGVDPDRIVLTNGLDEGILLASIAYLVPRAPRALVELGAPDLPPSGMPEILVALPTFEPYLHAATAMGARVVAVPAAPDYAFPVDAMLRAVTPNTRIIYVNNPNNPTGQPIPQEAIRRVAREAAARAGVRGRGVSRLPGRELPRRGRRLSQRDGRPHLLEGLRPGRHARRRALCVARRARTGPPVMPLFNLNVVAVAALRAALADPAYRAWYLAQAAAVQGAGLCRLDRLGLRYWKSAANFVLIDGGARAKEICRGMIARGVFVRDRSADPACANCFRVTAGVVEHTQKAVAALEAVCAAR